MDGRGLGTACPRQDSNLRSRLRRAVLYPLSYGGWIDRPIGEFERSARVAAYSSKHGIRPRPVGARVR